MPPGVHIGPLVDPVLGRREALFKGNKQLRQVTWEVPTRGPFKSKMVF